METFDPAFFEVLDRAEKEHFWFKARKKVISEVTKTLAPRLQDGCRILEIGCGTGNLLPALRDACLGARVFGTDLFSESLSITSKKCRFPLFRSDVLNPPIHHALDMVCLFDVLEHIPDDISALRHVHDTLRESGLIFLTVPAHPGLWSYADDIAHHQRRYTRKELLKKVRETGFVVEFCSPFMSWILPLAILKRKPGRNAKKVPLEVRKRREIDMFIDDLRIRPVLNSILFQLLRFEALFLKKRIQIPLGSSLLLVARKE